MDRHIDEIEFTIFDTETTGLDPRGGDRIVEIAALRFKGNRKIATFQTLVDPQRDISAAAFAVNKISALMLKGAPSIERVIPGFFDFVKDSCLCSYNAGFDLEFLYNELGIGGKPLAPFKEAAKQLFVVDVLKMARRLMPGLERYALWFVSETLGLRTQQSHRALSDVELTWEVFTRLKEKYTAKGLTGFKNFVGLFGLNPELLENISQQKVAQIQEALGSGAKLKIRYLSTSSAALTEREVIPKEIKAVRSHLYLVGHCCLRNEERSFRVDNILHIELV